MKRLVKTSLMRLLPVLLLLSSCAASGPRARGPETERSYLRAELVRSLFTENASKDQDGDGLADQMEGELANVFRPYLVFDSDEAARGPHEPVVLFQVRLSDVQGVTSEGTRIWRLAIKWVFLFRRDGGYGPSSWCGNDHEGDNDDALFELESRDDGVTWRLVRVALSSRGPDEFAGPEWPAYSELEVYDLTHPKIYMSAHKHHEYFNTDWDEEDSLYSSWYCNDDVNGEGASFLANVHSIAIREGHFTSFSRNHNNVGEWNAHSTPFVDDLSAFFPGHSAWGEADFYSDDAGPIKNKWLT